jgi:hypothetical protein
VSKANPNILGFSLTPQAQLRPFCLIDREQTSASCMLDSTIFHAMILRVFVGVRFAHPKLCDSEPPPIRLRAVSGSAGHQPRNGRHDTTTAVAGLVPRAPRETRKQVSPIPPRHSGEGRNPFPQPRHSGESRNPARIDWGEQSEPQHPWFFPDGTGAIAPLLPD